MDIHMTIENVRRYFSYKLSINDFEVVELDKYHAKVEIEGYCFYLWIGSGINYFDFFDNNLLGGNMFNFNFLNDYQKDQSYRHVMNAIKKKQEEVSKQEIENQINELQKQLKQII